MNLIGGPLEVLRQAAAFALRRHELLAQNVANADTPGFRAHDLAFASELSIAQQTASLPADAIGAPALDVRIVENPDPVSRQDGNTVELDRQMARMAQNTVYHNTVVQLMTAQLRNLRTAINGHA
jgi:flagellar basal-body rod protein FlgB